ncbi:MAG: DNA translocase FtsK, partial [Myxococcota bacterium]|nr:DNA translocase FtsK [Myxococcota bacterium]
MRVAKELPDGAYVNLGIGIPTLVSSFVPEGKAVFYHSESGILNCGPLAEEGQEDIDLINAGGQFLEPVPGMAFFGSADAFAMIRGGQVDLAVLGSHQVSAKGDLANWMLPHRGVGNVGGAMDLAVGAREVIVAMEHTDRENRPKIVESEHLQSQPRDDVDSLRGWSRDVRFRVPQLSLLDPVPVERADYSEEELHRNARLLEKKLADYGVTGRVVEIHPGPVITMYEFEPAPGVKISRIQGLSDDLSMALKAVRVRIVAPLPGKGVVGVEVPNRKRQTVYLREVLAQDAAAIDGRALPIALGKDIVGKPTMADLAKMPHLLIAGTTGSGKSVAVNSMLMSLLLSRTPDEVRMIMIDPKMIEFAVYEHSPHLLLPVVTDPRRAAAALRWAVGEMTRRYEMLRFLKKRNVVGANQAIEKAQQAFDREGDAGLPWDPDDPAVPFAGRPEKLPYIVIVIDELADLMMVARKDVEDGIVRLAQMARAAGIHLMIATQRPSVDVITGLIKANFPARM